MKFRSFAVDYNAEAIDALLDRQGAREPAVWIQQPPPTNDAVPLTASESETDDEDGHNDSFISSRLNEENLGTNRMETSKEPLVHQQKELSPLNNYHWPMDDDDDDDPMYAQNDSTVIVQPRTPIRHLFGPNFDDEEITKKPPTGMNQERKSRGGLAIPKAVSPLQKSTATPAQTKEQAIARASDQTLVLATPQVDQKGAHKKANLDADRDNGNPEDTAKKEQSKSIVSSGVSGEHAVAKDAADDRSMVRPGYIIREYNVLKCYVTYDTHNFHYAVLTFLLQGRGSPQRQSALEDGVVATTPKVKKGSPQDQKEMLQASKITKMPTSRQKRNFDAVNMEQQGLKVQDYRNETGTNSFGPNTKSASSNSSKKARRTTEQAKISVMNSLKQSLCIKRIASDPFSVYSLQDGGTVHPICPPWITNWIRYSQVDLRLNFFEGFAVFRKNSFLSGYFGPFYLGSQESRRQVRLQELQTTKTIEWSPSPIKQYRLEMEKCLPRDEKISPATAGNEKRIESEDEIMVVDDISNDHASQEYTWSEESQKPSRINIIQNNKSVAKGTSSNGESLKMSTTSSATEEVWQAAVMVAMFALQHKQPRQGPRQHRQQSFAEPILCLPSAQPHRSPRQVGQGNAAGKEVEGTPTKNLRKRKIAPSAPAQELALFDLQRSATKARDMGQNYSEQRSPSRPRYPRASPNNSCQTMRAPETQDFDEETFSGQLPSIEEEPHRPTEKKHDQTEATTSENLEMNFIVGIGPALSNSKSTCDFHLGQLRARGEAERESSQVDGQKETPSDFIVKRQAISHQSSPSPIESGAAVDSPAMIFSPRGGQCIGSHELQKSHGDTALFVRSDHQELVDDQLRGQCAGGASQGGEWKETRKEAAEARKEKKRKRKRERRGTKKEKKERRKQKKQQKKSKKVAEDDEIVCLGVRPSPGIRDERNEPPFDTPAQITEATKQRKQATQYLPQPHQEAKTTPCPCGPPTISVEEKISNEQRIFSGSEEGMDVFNNIKDATATVTPQLRSKFSALPPLQVLCSEAFLEGWGEVAAELSAGRWTPVGDINKEIADPIPDSATLGRKISFVDSPLVDVCEVDLELPGVSNTEQGKENKRTRARTNRLTELCLLHTFLQARSIIVQRMSICAESMEARKAFHKKLLHLAATERYLSIVLILCVDGDLSNIQASEVQELHNSFAGNDSPTRVHFQVTSVTALSCCIAKTILKSASSPEITTSTYQKMLTCANDTQVSRRANFFIQLLPTITAVDALQCFAAGAERGENDPVKQFQLLLGSEIERQKICGTSRPNEKPAINPKSMQQLSFVLNTCLRTMENSDL